LRKLQINELEEIRNDAYENSRIHKARIKELHDKKILRKTFNVYQKVLLYNYQLHLFRGKLRSRWSDPFIVKHVYPYKACDIENPKNDNVFKVNRHRLKVYFDNFSVENDSIELSDPIYKDRFFLSHCFCVSFLCEFCFASLSHPGQMADNGNPWLLSWFFQFPIITDICVYICAILCSFSFLCISSPILIWKWTPLLKN